MPWGKNLQQEHDQKIDKINRQYSQGPANVEFSKTYASSLNVFLKKQMSNQEAADYKKEPNA